MRRSIPSAILAVTLTFGFVLAACETEPQLIRRSQIDVFTQEIRKTVDILLVVDNSGSMIDEQIKLAANFDNFISQFLEAEVDYQIGVVTTDMDDPTQSGRLVGETKLITSDMTVDVARETFQANVRVCATGSGFERGFAAAEAALSADFLAAGGPNEGLVREDAALSIVFVSDEDDDSSRPVGHYLEVFKGLKGDRGYRDDTLINMSAVVGPPPDGCEQPEPFIPDCADGLADDEEGNVDCASAICASSWWCSVVDRVETECGDGLDDDGDGAVDCDDADCGALDSCRETSCGDEVDNDGDGDVDCDDLDCLVGFPEICGEISCDDDELTHHGDYYNWDMDCEDPSCFAWEETCFAERVEIDFAERCHESVLLDRSTGSLLFLDGPDIDSLDGQAELAGCDDPDCASYYLCTPGLSIEGHNSCSNCFDDDGDGLEDCEDTDCLDSVYCDNPYPIEPGLRYIDVATRSGGIVTSICAEEFSGLVRELGLNISGLRSIFYLTAWPVVETLAVYANSVTEENLLVEGWSYDPVENRLLFTQEAIPGEGTAILVQYDRSNEPPSEQDVPEGGE